MPQAPPVTSAVRSSSRKPRASLRHTIPAMSLRIGYKASAEQFGPARAARLHDRGGAPRLRARRRVGPLPALAPHGRPLAGGAPLARRAAGQRTSDLVLGTSVLTPTLRYHPSVIAQAFATLGCLTPGRVFLGVGTGEAMNETPGRPAGSSPAARSAGCAWPRRSS